MFEIYIRKVEEMKKLGKDDKRQKR